MTLIQTYFAQDRVIQVADRRLTRANGEPHDDNHTKLVFWHGCFTVGFTGIAYINRAQTKPVSEWIAETLCEYRNFEQGCQALGAEAEKRIRLLPDTWDKRLSIVVSGFDFRRDPLVGHITNFLPGQNNLNVFKWAAGKRVLGIEESHLIVGANVPPSHHEILRRYLRRAVKQPDGLNRAIRIMVELQRKVAATDHTVGVSALCATIPRDRSVHGPGTIMSNLGAADVSEIGCQFSYFDEHGFDHRQFGPHTASHGIAMGGYFAEADSSNLDRQHASFRFLRIVRNTPDQE